MGGVTVLGVKTVLFKRVNFIHILFFFFFFSLPKFTLGTPLRLNALCIRFMKMLDSPCPQFRDHLYRVSQFESAVHFLGRVESMQKVLLHVFSGLWSCEVPCSTNLQPVISGVWNFHKQSDRNFIFDHPGFFGKCQSRFAFQQWNGG